MLEWLTHATSPRIRGQTPPLPLFTRDQYQACTALERASGARDRNRRKLNFPTLFATGHRLGESRSSPMVNLDLIHSFYSAVMVQQVTHDELLMICDLCESY